MLLYGRFRFKSYWGQSSKVGSQLDLLFVFIILLTHTQPHDPEVALKISKIKYSDDSRYVLVVTFRNKAPINNHFPLLSIYLLFTISIYRRRWFQDVLQAKSRVFNWILICDYESQYISETASICNVGSKGVEVFPPCMHVLIGL